MITGREIDLAPLEDDDFASLALWSGAPSGQLANGMGMHASPGQLREALSQDTGELLRVASKSGELLGFCNYRSIAYHGNYEIGVSVGEEDKWGRGYGYEAGMLLLWYLFHQLNANRVQMLVGEFNGPMLRMVQASPWVVEGVLRQYFFCDGRYFDAVAASMLRAEFYAGAGKLGQSYGMNVMPAEVVQSGIELMASMRDELATTMTRSKT